MFGYILVIIASFFREISSSIGKTEVAERKESIYTLGFLNLFWTTAIFIFTLIFIEQEFKFSQASLPTFAIRAVLEIVQAHMSILALTLADRSTFGFLRITTIPLLLAADVTLGYSLSANHLVGTSIIVLSLLILFLNHGMSKKGSWFVVFISLNAVITISLFKYDITHFNSVAAEQTLIGSILMAYFLSRAVLSKKENPIAFLRKPIFFAQSATQGIGSVMTSFAYVFAPASIILTVERSADILWSIVSGNFYFHEKHAAVKLAAFLFIVIGFVLLSL